MLNKHIKAFFQRYVSKKGEAKSPEVTVTYLLPTSQAWTYTCGIQAPMFHRKMQAIKSGSDFFVVYLSKCPFRDVLQPNMQSLMTPQNCLFRKEHPIKLLKILIDIL